MYADIESVFCGKNVDFELRQGSSWVGLKESDAHGAGYYMNDNLGIASNVATYYTVKPYDASKSGALTFFDSEGCTGQSGRIYWDEKAPIVTLNDFKSRHIYFKESLASVLLPPGYELEMWEDVQ